VSYPRRRLEFVILGAVTFAFCLYTVLVWREKRAERLRTAPPTGRMSAYRGALPAPRTLGVGAPLMINAAALGTFAFAFLVPVELLVDRLAARMARRMSQKGAVPLAFVPSWRTGAWLWQRDPKAENEVERLHRLQVLVNLFLMVGLAISASALSSHPLVLGGLGALLLLRAFHTRLLGKVAKSFDPAADRLPGLMETPDGGEQKEEEVPPWLSRALTRRAENRLGAAPLGSARPREVRVAVAPTDAAKEEAAPIAAEEALQQDALERDALEEDAPDQDVDQAPKARRTIG
jgi:hypothetical protein